MDCTPFIRTRWLPVAWIAVPLLVLVGFGLAVNGFLRHQLISFDQRKTMAAMAPELERAAVDADRFLDRFRLNAPAGTSAQDFFIGMVSSAAEQTGFLTESIYVDQQTLDDVAGVAKVIIRLRGTGTARQTAEFLNSVYEADSMLSIDTLKMAPSGKSPQILSVETDLIKIYAE